MSFFPLFVSKGIYHDWKYELIFSRGLKQTEVSGFSAPEGDQTASPMSRNVYSGTSLLFFACEGAKGLCGPSAY